MNRSLTTLLLAIPLAAICALPKSASAEPANRDHRYDRQSVSSQRDHRDNRPDRPSVTMQRDNRPYDRNREPNSTQRHGRHQRQEWQAAHREKVKPHHQGIPGQHEQR
jgi:hypothetical protein